MSGEPRGDVTQRRWPVVFALRLRRCHAWRYDDEERRFCGRLIWPWQRLVREWDPECGGALVHHDCHHYATRSLWEREYGEAWTSWLHCEHVTDRADPTHD